MISDSQLQTIVHGFGYASVGLILAYHFILANTKDDMEDKTD